MDNSSITMTGTRKKKIQVTLEKVFQKLNKEYVKINKIERIQNNDILYSVLDKFLNIMRTCDELFNNMKPKLAYMGSYFEGLRVGHPTEFDINVILKIPVNYDKIVLDASKTQHDYTYIIMPSEFRRLYTNPHTASKGFKKTAMWCDHNYRLSVSKFRSWMQSVVDAALSQLPVEGDNRIIFLKNKRFKVKSKLSGPANNITIVHDNNVVDIDLVPTFQFELPKKPIESNVDFTKYEFAKIKQYFVVPKPTEDNFNWRLTFPFQERLCIKNKDNLKSAIRLIKLFRDVQGFNKLASYFIKTIFLLEVLQTNETFWKTNSLSFLVLHMLSKLQEALAQGIIRNYWCPESNIISKIKPETCENWSNRIALILRQIKRYQHIDPYLVIQYFSTQQEIM